MIFIVRLAFGFILNLVRSCNYNIFNVTQLVVALILSTSLIHCRCTALFVRRKVERYLPH